MNPNPQISNSFQAANDACRHHDRRRALIHLMQYAALDIECYPSRTDACRLSGDTGDTGDKCYRQSAVWAQ
jgi:hypothetical protein